MMKNFENLTEIENLRTELSDIKNRLMESESNFIHLQASADLEKVNKLTVRLTFSSESSNVFRVFRQIWRTRKVSWRPRRRFCGRKLTSFNRKTTNYTPKSNG